MDLNELLKNLWANHRGKVIGVIAGLLFAGFVISFGFWRSLFIFFCVGVGLFIGVLVDKENGVVNGIKQVFKKND